MNISTKLLRAVCFAASVSYGPASSAGAAITKLDESIRQIRMGTLVIEAAPGAEVRVEQLRHEFWFGAALASQMFRGGPDGEEASRYKKVFLENFNAAVTENALKWHSMEQRKGEVDYAVGGAQARRLSSFLRQSDLYSFIWLLSSPGKSVILA